LPLRPQDRGGEIPPLIAAGRSRLQFTDDSNGEVVVGGRERRQKIGGGVIVGVRQQEGPPECSASPEPDISVIALPIRDLKSWELCSAIPRSAFKGSGRTAAESAS
jgi:hypothetical protein